MKTAVIYILIVFSSLVAAAQNPSFLDSSRVVVNQIHGEFSNGIFRISDRLDSILGHDIANDERPKSQIRIKYGSLMTDSANAQNNIRFQSKIVLPRTQKRFHLIVHNWNDRLHDDKGEATKAPLIAKSNEEKQAEESDYAAALRFVALQGRRLRIHTDAGIKLRAPVDPFVKVAAKQTFRLSRWELNFNQNVALFEKAGVDSDIGADLIRPLSSSLWFRMNSITKWTEQEDTFNSHHGISILQTLKKNRSLNYFVSASGTSRPKVNMSVYNIGISLRTPIGWRWLIFEATPMGSYPRASGFAFRPSINLSLEATIGYM